MWILIELRPFYISDIGSMIQRKAQDPDFQLIIIVRGNVLSIGDLYWAYIVDQTQNDTFEFLLNVQKYSFIYQQLYFIHSFPSFIFNSFLSFILFFHFF